MAATVGSQHHWRSPRRPPAAVIKTAASGKAGIKNKSVFDVKHKKRSLHHEKIDHNEFSRKGAKAQRIKKEET
jgi:hypothetical protein